MVISNWEQNFSNIPRSGQPTETEKSDISGTGCLFPFLIFLSHVMKKPIPKFKICLCLFPCLMKNLINKTTEQLEDSF